MGAEVEELRAKNAGLESALGSCQQELNDVLEDRWGVGGATRLVLCTRSGGVLVGT
jgi:hypothetical protein